MKESLWLVSCVQLGLIALGPTREPGPQRPSPRHVWRGAWQFHPLGSVRKTPDYTAKVNLIEKVLDFDQLGGPILTIDRTVFEMWLGTL